MADLAVLIRQLQGAAWADVTFMANWQSLAGYPVQVSACGPRLGVLRGIATRVGAGFAFGNATREMFALPAKFALHDGGSGNQAVPVWGTDATPTNSMYRMVLRVSDRVFYLDQALTGIGATGAAGSIFLLDGVTFALAGG